MENVPITVLMTVYNGGEYLKQSMKSVLSQTFQDFEFLIVDDCSTDESIQTINSFGDPRIRLHKNERNMGQTCSLNVGLRLARGKYVARIDADDLAASRWLEVIYPYFESHPDHAVVSAQAVIMDSAGKPNKILRSSSTHSDVLLKCLIASPINHGGCLMNREIILENSGYDENYKLAADFDLWSRLIRKGYKFASVDDFVMAIRVHEGSESIKEKGKKDKEELAQILMNNINSLTEMNIDEEDARLLWELIYDTGCLNKDVFLAANDLIKKIYRGLKPSLGIDRSKSEQFLKNQILVNSVKRAFVCGAKEDVKGFRRVSLDYIRENGTLNIFSLFVLSSLFGRYLVRRMENIYRKMLELKVSINLRGNSTFGFSPS